MDRPFVLDYARKLEKMSFYLAVRKIIPKFCSRYPLKGNIKYESRYEDEQNYRRMSKADFRVSFLKPTFFK